MKILVTGATGFIGKYVCAAARDRGHAVMAIDRHAGSIGPSIDGLYVADLRDLATFHGAIMKSSPDAVIHLAAQSSIATSWKAADQTVLDNELGTVNLLGMCQKFGVKRFAFASTSAVYAPKPDGIYREGDTVRPETPYGVSKLACEDYIRISGVPYRILRLGNVYGPGQKPLGESILIARYLDHVFNGKPFVINGDGKQTRDFVHVRDVARAFVLAIEKDVSDITMNIATGEGMSVNGIVGALAASVQRVHGFYPDPVEHGPAKEGELRHVVLMSDLAHRVLGWDADVELGSALLELVR